MTKQIRRSGFTLPEVLVTVTVVAVLAAVVVPAVTGYVSRGNAPALAQDLDAIRGSLTAFVSDTRRYPANFYELTTDPSVSGWKGPYIQTILAGATAAGTFSSEGFKLDLGNTFFADTGFLSTNFTFKSGGKCADLWALDETVDNSSITDNASVTAAKSAGSIRWTATTCDAYETPATASTAITTVTGGKIRLIATGS